MHGGRTRKSEVNTLSIKSPPSEGRERFDLGEDDWSDIIDLSDSDFFNESDKERNEMTVQTIMGQKVSLTLNEENVEDDVKESAVSIIENCIKQGVSEGVLCIISNKGKSLHMGSWCISG